MGTHGTHLRAGESLDNVRTLHFKDGQWAVPWEDEGEAVAAGQPV